MLGVVEFVMRDVVGEQTLLGDVELVTRGEFRDGCLGENSNEIDWKRCQVCHATYC